MRQPIFPIVSSRMRQSAPGPRVIGGGRDTALGMAIRLYRSPVLARSLAGMPLPDGMTVVVRLAGGCPETLAAAVRRTGLPEHTVREAASLYLLVVLFARGASPYRLLGLRENAAPEDIRHHKNWLLKWLHPDLNPNKAIAAQAARVITAGSILLNGEASLDMVQRPSDGGRRSVRIRWVMEPASD